jgi:uncharacterized membrane protein
MLHKTLISLMGSLLLLGTAAATESSFTYISINYPGAKFTVAQGINPGGEVTGKYADASGVSHGFVLRQGVFTSIDYPGAMYTDVRGVNPAGDIVGNFVMPGENPPFVVTPGSTPINIHGFVLTRDGTFIPLAYPGHPNMLAQRILPDGAVMGCIHDHDYMASMRGFLWNHGVWTALDGSEDGLNVPDSMNNGATPDLGQIAGLFTDMTLNKIHAYVIQNGTFTPFDYPGAASTRAWDMSPSGAIVGDCSDATGPHGFLLENGSFVSLTFPGATNTQARGINPGGAIVGWYQDAAGTHGFLAIPMPRHGQ